eukprot:1661933-Amphidinium_carterae.1
MVQLAVVSSFGELDALDVVCSHSGHVKPSLDTMRLGSSFFDALAEILLAGRAVNGIPRPYMHVRPSVGLQPKQSKIAPLMPEYCKMVQIYSSVPPVLDGIFVADDFDPDVPSGARVLKWGDER